MSFPISDVKRRVVYSGSAGTGPYSFSFEILANTDIDVYKNSTLLTLTTDYTVFIDTDGTGSVTLVSAATGSDNITLVGARSIERSTDFVTGGDLFANTLNQELDSVVIFAQQVDEKADRGLKAPITDPTDINMVLPVKTSRRGKVLAFDETTGDPVAGPDLSAMTTVIAQSANINTVAANIASVNTVAGNTTNVNTVAGISGNVTTVAGISSNVTTVAGISSNVTSVAGNATNINAVAANATNINNVAGNATNINAVAGDLTDIGTAAGLSTEIAALGPIAADITAVAAIDSDVTAVAGDAADIGTVAGNIANINTVAGISGNVTTVAGISANVSTVAGISANVTTVAGNSANVSTVAGISADVTSVAGVASDIPTVAANVADITNFADVYLGPKSSDPAARNDSSALQTGDLYFNTVADEMRVYTGTAWKATGSAVNGTTKRQTFTATSGQTTFSITGGYDAGFIDVYLNGVKLVNGVDVTVTSGTDVVLASGAALNDVVDVIAYGAFVLANTYTQAQTDSLLAGKVNKAGDTMTGGLTLGGALNLGSTGQIQFPATQNASSNANTLDDYEEGSFTPFWFASGGGLTPTYFEQTGIYIKIGRMVYFRFRLVTGGSTGGTGELRFGGLPFTQVNNGNSGFTSLNFTYGWSTAGNAVLAMVCSGNTTELTCYTQYGGFNSNVQTPAGSLAGATVYVVGGGCYEATA